MTGAEDTSPARWVALGEAAPEPVAPPRRRLFRKYALLVVGLVGAALLINSGFDFWFSYQENKAALVRVQQEKAEAAAQRIAEFVEEIKSQIGWTTHAQWAVGPLDQRRQDYVRLLRQVPAITELQQLDGDGKERLKVSRLAMDVVDSGADLSQSSAFTEAKAHRTWFSPVYFRKESEPYMTLAMARDGRNAGVTVAEINLKLIWDVITALKIGQGGYAYVVDGRGRLIAHPDISLVLRDTDLSKLPQVAAALAPTPGDSAVTVAKSLGDRWVLTAHAAIPQLGWRVFVEVPLAEAFAPLYGAALRTLALLALGLIAATLVALVIARRMTGPIRALQQGAAEIGAGDLGRRIDIHTGDELEGLAQQFNHMAADLQKSYAELEQRVADRTAELSEALEQQTATAEVLGVINSSPGDLTPVFDAMLEKAVRLLNADFGILWRFDDELMRLGASHNVPAAFVEYHHEPMRPGPESGPGRMIRGDSAFAVGNLLEFPPYLAGDPAVRAIVDLAGARSLVIAPLRKDGSALGAITIYRQEVRPFTDKQIALLQNFAAQAVIAMENARLITETREALEQQTATAEVLGVINSSPGELGPVFEAMLEKATSLCGAAFGIMNTFDGERFNTVALHGVPTPLQELLLSTQPQPGPFSGPGRLMRGEDAVRTEDLATNPGYQSGDPRTRALVDLGGVRSYVAAALRKDGNLLGTIAAYRKEVRPFTDKQVALLQNFAAQAVIAMENARLITETREALEQQTATAEVLGVINASPGDLAPVFDAMLEKAMRLCGAAFGELQTYDGERFEMAALRGLPPRYAEFRTSRTHVYGPGTIPARLLADERPVHVLDITAEDAYRDGEPNRLALADLGGARTVLAVPLLKDGAVLGFIVSCRQEARPFTDKQIALLQNFAAQAVIAMENARLISETREALDQQTATAEVLGVINSSPGDLAPVFDAVLGKACALCQAAFGALVTYDGEQFRTVTTHGVPAALAELWSSEQPQPRPGDSLHLLANGERLVQVEDMSATEAYLSGSPRRRAIVELGGARSYAVVALRRDDALMGAIQVYRQEVRPFSDKQVALLQNFGAQAVIAMENARLITETREALEQQTATAEVLGVINSSPGDLAPVFEAMLEKATTLCESAHGALFIKDGERFRAIPSRSTPKAFVEFLTREPIYFDPERSIMARTLQQHSALQVTDMRESDPYRNKIPIAVAAVETAGTRTLLSVPMFREDAPVGIFQLARQEVRPFTEKQIALLQNFAAQAVIAIENTRLISETREALEQQTATAEVLGVINASPGNLAPVFDAILQKASTLCDVAYGSLELYDGENFRAVATVGFSDAFADLVRQGYRAAESPDTRALIEGERFSHILDLAETDSAMTRSAAELEGHRTLLCVPLRRENQLVGLISSARKEVRPFSDKEIALIENFAAQAVIAMENARLITETREALEQQTATAEVLGVINASPGDLGPVFEAVLDKAMRLCEAAFGTFLTFDGGQFNAVAHRGVPAELVDTLREPGRPTPGGSFARLVGGETVVHLADIADDDAYRRGLRGRVAMVDIGGARTAVWVALRKDDALLGTLVIYRQEVRPFSDKQLALLQNFAAQAVIAMENARLITETRERTRDLQESLEYQTATSDVLKVISRSVFDLDTVLQTVVATAIRLCRADTAIIYRNEGGAYRWAAGQLVMPEYEARERTTSIRPGTGTVVGRAALEGRTVQILDAWTDPLYEAKEDARIGGVHTMIGVPLLREGQPIGAIALARTRVESFTDKQIELVTTFADQAVIAIENARLLTELRARTDELAHSVEELKALAEVGQAVSSTLDLGAVLSTVLNRSVALTEADAGVIFRYSQGRGAFRIEEAVGWEAALVAQVRAMHIDRNATLMGEAVTRRAPAQIADLRDRPSNVLRDATLAAGYRSILIVPLVGADQIYGALLLQRRRPGEFPEAAVRLMQTLAAQSVLAIQNARLFREIADKSEQLALASQHKSQFLANMSHELRTPLNAILGYSELLVDGIYGEVPARAMGVLERVQNNGRHLLALINDVLDLSKIEAGQLVLTLEDYAMPDVVQSVVSATEGLASTKGLKLSATVAPGLPTGHGDARRLSQVLLNLVGNAVKFTDEGEVAIGALAEGGHFVLTVRDTGPGIAPEDQDKIFGEFQQVDNSNTRKKGGTGLGLAISKRMVEMQGGSITVESALGHGATFRVALPIRVEAVADELTGELMGAA